MALDGLEFTMSRTALLDIFLMFWLLAAFGCLVIDRDRARERLAASVGVSSDGPGPRLRVRWWRVLAGVCLGLACASKWDAIWYIIAFIGLTVAWDIGARRAAGFRSFGRGALADGRWTLLSLLVVPAAVYIASWSGWFASSIGWDRNYAAQHGVGTPVISALYSLFEYHKEMLNYHIHLHAYHPYRSQPWTWLVLSLAGRVLLREPERGPRRLPGSTLLAGGPGDRYAGNLVGVDCGAHGPDHLVADPTGLAGGGCAARRVSGLAALVRLPGPDQVLLLRGVVRAIPDIGDHAVPWLDHGIGPFVTAAARHRRGNRRRVPACRRAELLVPVPASRGEGDPVQRLARPDVVLKLDLTSPGR